MRLCVVQAPQGRIAHQERKGKEKERHADEQKGELEVLTLER
jgi:hypothetical protein